MISALLSTMLFLIELCRIGVRTYQDMSYLPFPISIAIAVLWIAILFVLVPRLTAVDIRRVKPAIRGALSWGFAMFIASIADDYLRSRLIGDSSFRPSILGIGASLLWWLLGGAFFGWSFWSRTARAK